jgi:hypothetical protein
MAGGIAGLALWLTAGSLDAVDGVAGAVRVAMLPPFWMAAALALAGAILGVAVSRVVARLAAGHWRRVEDEDDEVLLPLCATACVALPFLPWLADLVPAWTTLASPFVMLVWFVTGGLAARAVFLRIWQARSWPQPALPVSPTMGVLLVSAMVSGVAAIRLVETPIFPGGDEPHYLVIAQSVWRDGDLKIENNHRRGDTLEYFARPLKPDYLTRGVDREIYSIHPVGLGVLLAPVYALGGYRAVVAFLVLVAAAAATCAWRLAARLTDPVSARFAWLACALTAPWVFNSFTVYPEVPAALAVIVAFSLALGLDAIGSRYRLWAALAGCGLAIATLPWLSSKYALMGAALGLMAMARLWLPGWLANAAAVVARRPLVDRVVATIALAVAPLVSGVAWLAFFQIIWGRLSPSAPYGTQHAMDLGYLVAGGPGLYFDQEYGVVAAAPVLLLALTGLVGMLRRGGGDRRVALEITAVSLSLLVTVAAFHIWWGGTAAVGRPLISALLLLVVPCAWQLRAWSTSPARTAAAWLLLLASLAMAATLAFAQEGLLLVAERDGTSRLLSYWAPAWRLWSLAPSFVVQPAVRAAIITALWIAAALASLATVARLARTATTGRSGLAAAAAAFVALTAVAILVTPMAGRASTPGSALSARARSPLLDTFDAARRPVGIVFDPLRLASPLEVAGLVHFMARPDDGRLAPMTPLLNGARWAWAAGNYDIEIRAASGATPLAGELGLQAGRTGPPLVTWTLDPAAGSAWRGRVSLPIDVGFIGFKASPALAAVRPRIDVRAAHMVDLSRRLPPMDVVQARAFGHAIVFFHDDNADPEPAGFWTRRDRTTRITVSAAGSSPRLRLRSGAADIRAVVRVSRRAESFDLAANTARDVALPPSPGPWRVEIITRGGFVPAEHDRNTRDTRALGCWIEIVDGP